MCVRGIRILDLRVWRSHVGRLQFVWCLLFFYVCHFTFNYYYSAEVDKPWLPYNKNIPLIRYFDRRGFGVPMLPNRTTLWTANVQLCVMFNSFISNKLIGLLLSYYSQFFNHVTLISGTKVITRPHFVTDSVQVFNCDSYYGLYQHRCLKICLENPANDNVEGFLYIADDMFVSITKLGHLNRTKLWFVPIKPYDYAELEKMSIIELQRMWYFFGFPNFNRNALKTFIHNLPTEWLTLLEKNAGFPDKFEIRAVSDIIYIPRSLSTQARAAVNLITNRSHLNTEIAVPLVVGFISHHSQREILTYGYLWREKRDSVIAKQKKATLSHFVHPLKLSSDEDKKLWQELMKHQLQLASQLEKSMS